MINITDDATVAPITPKTTSIFDGNGNVYNVANERDTNLKLDLSGGVSAEFWLKLDGRS